MRRFAAVLLAATFVAPAVVILPTVPLPGAGRHPVRTSVTSLAFGSAAQRAAGGLVASTSAHPAVDRTATTQLGALHTAGFESIAVSWDATLRVVPKLVVMVRTHSTTGWTPWSALQKDDSDAVGPAAIAGHLRGGTEPRWVGPSDGAQATVSSGAGLPPGLRLDLVDPGVSSYDALAGLTPPGSASAVTTAPVILSRASWGADERRVRAAATVAPSVLAGAIHHTDDTNNYTAAQVPAMLRSDFAYHLSRGWNDIGYNFVVDKFGRIWEGRAGGVTEAVVGAHAGGFNWQTFGVAMIGNYTTAKPSSAAITAIERLFAWKLDLAHADPLGRTFLTAASFSGARWASGTRVSVPVIMGHRDVDTTECPGDNLYALLPKIRADVALLMRAAILNPVVSATTISARSLTRQTWRLTVTEDCSGHTVATSTGAAPARGLIKAAWNRRIATAVARPGIYGLRLDSSAGGTPARPVTSRFTVAAPPAPPVITVPAPTVPAPTNQASPGSFVPLAPTTVLDTRSGATTAIGADGRVDVPVLGVAGVPTSGVSAVALSVTAVCPTESTSISVWPAGSASTASALSLPAKATRNAVLTSAPGVRGMISIGNWRGITNLVVDVLGYYRAEPTPDPAVAHYLPVAPTTIYDGRFIAGQSRSVAVPPLAGVSVETITAVQARVIVMHSTGSGSAGLNGSRPDLYYDGGTDTQMLTLARPVAGLLTLSNTGGGAQIVVQVIGLWTTTPAARQSLVTVPRVRIFDSRSEGGQLKAGMIREVLVTAHGSTLTGVPADASAVLVALTGLHPSQATGITAWGSGTLRPSGADLLLRANDVRTTETVVPLGAGGKISLAGSAGSTHLLADVVGYLR